MRHLLQRKLSCEILFDFLMSDAMILLDIDI